MRWAYLMRDKLQNITFNVINGLVVAVGIAVTGYPPRRSGRVLLTHPAPTSGSGVEALHGIRGYYPGRRDPGSSHNRLKRAQFILCR